jgi:hypothetical protein
MDTTSNAPPEEFRLKERQNLTQRRLATRHQHPHQTTKLLSAAYVCSSQPHQHKKFKKKKEKTES